MMKVAAMAMQRELWFPVETSAGASPVVKAKPRRRGRVLLMSLLGVVVLLVVLVILAPTIASGMLAPKVASAVNEKIKGSVKIDAIKVGWLSPTVVGPVEILDPSGKSVGKVRVGSEATLWRVVSERWWSMKNLDVGVVEVSGNMSVTKDADGKTNLQKALEPKQASSASPSSSSGSQGSSSGGLESVKADVRLQSIDIEYADLSQGTGNAAQAMGLKGLAGGAKVDYATKGAGRLVSTVDLSGTPTGAAASAGAEALKVKVDADMSNFGAGSTSPLGLPDIKVLKADVRNVPLTLVDALANMNGSLVRDVGPRADVQIDAQGTSAKVLLVSDGAKANLDLQTQGNLLVAAAPTDGNASGAGSPNTVTLRSTEFLGSAPGLREALQRAASQVQLDKSPGVEIVIEKLRLPIAGGGGAGNAGAQGDGLAGADMRGNGLVLKLRVSEMAGRVALEKPTVIGVGATPPSVPMRAFSVAPFEVVVDAPDLSKGLTVTGGTRATIDGANAGQMSLRVVADGLLDAQGRVKALGDNKAAGLADNIDARVSLQGMSTALVQPLVSTAGLGLDLPRDVGPTIDLTLAAKAAGGVGAAGGGQAIPPLDWTVQVASQNVNANGAGRFADQVVTTSGEGLNVRVGSASGLVNGILAKPGQTPAFVLSGPGALSLTVRDLHAPVDKLSGAEALGAVKALVNVDVSNLSVGMPPAAGAQPAQPVQVTKFGMNVKLDGVNPPSADIAGQMSHEGQAFELVGNARADGVKNGRIPEGQGVAKLIALKPTARLELKNMPRSVLNLVPATSAYGTAAVTGADMTAQISRAVRESIGQSANVTLNTQPSGNAQDVAIKLTTAAGGVSGDVDAKITEKDLAVSTMKLVASMNPQVVNPILAAANTPEPGKPAGPPIQLGQAFTLTVSSPSAVTVPFKPGTTEPDWAKADDARIVVATDNDIAIQNVPTGTDPNGQARVTGVRIKNLGADLTAPLSGLDAGGAGKSKTASAKFQLLAARDGDNATIAKVNGTASATMAGENLSADVALSDIDTAVAEGLIGKPSLLTGALGDKAQATLKVQPKGGGTTTIAADINAPRLSEAKLTLTQTAEMIKLDQPANITWRPDASFVNSYLLGNQPGHPATGTRLGEASAVTMRLTKLTLATSKTENGQQTAGPLKPGVFEVDAEIDVPSVTLITPGAPPKVQKQGALEKLGEPLRELGGLVRGKNNEQPEPAAANPDVSTKIEGLKIVAKQAAGTPELVANLGIAKVNGQATNAANAQSGATVRLANLADQRGVIDFKKSTINLQAALAAFPTAVLDGLARQNGLLAELLGPTVNLNATMQNVTLASAAPATGQPAQAGAAANMGGTVQATMTSPRASAQLQGNIIDGAFVQTGEIKATITEMRKQLIDLLSGGIPTVESVEKTSKDQPATIIATNLRAPVDGDITKLNGTVSVDPGVAQFKLKSALGDLLEAVGANTEGKFGDKIQPFVVNMNRGVLTYDRFSVPLGSFSLDTRGTVDLVQRQINVVTYAPLGALSNRAIGRLDSGLASRLGGIDKLTQIPIVTKGPIDNPSTTPDFGLALKETVSNPGKIIDALGGLLGGDKDKKDGGGGAQPTPQQPSPAQPVQPTQPQPPKKDPPKKDPPKTEPKKEEPAKPEPAKPEQKPRPNRPNKPKPANPATPPG